MRKPFEYPQTIKEQKCACGKLYQARWLLIVDEWRDTTSGMCPECFKAWKDKLLADERKNLQIEKEKAHELYVSERRERMRIYSSGIPLYYQQKRLTGINVHVKGNMKKLLPHCMKYSDEYPIGYKTYISKNPPYPSMVISSPNVWGCGKTHLVCGILHKVLDRWQGQTVECPVLFATEPDIYMKIQGTYSYDDKEKRVRQSETDIINELVNVPLLVVDDLGKQKRSDMRFVQRTLFAIINGRYDRMLPMILTSNMTEGQLLAYLGGNDTEFDEASFNRLMEMCKGNMWILEGESQRGK